MPSLETEYQEALDYLYSYVDFSLTRNLQFSPESFTLTHMTELLRQMGDPHTRYPVIHIAGTKGKGSTGAMIASILQAAGYKVGFYSSPHLEDFCERIQINRHYIPHQRLVDIVDRMKPAVDRIKRLTTFELTTTAGFLYFAEEQVDVAVIEVGLGGRLDSTNVVDPLVSVITSISLDHMNVLGDSVEKIAAEKGGIIKPGKPVVISHQQPPVMRVLENIAAEKNAQIYRVDSLFTGEVLSRSLGQQTLRLSPTPGKGGEAVDFETPLLGDHQLENAATAYTCARILQQGDFSISPEAIRNGFAQVKWPGRFEVLQAEPGIIIDSAHNQDSALKLARTIETNFPRAEVILVFGASEDKDVAGMFKELLPHANSLILTQSIHPRSFPAEQLARLAEPYQIPARVVLPLETAVEAGMQELKPGKVMIVCGSIFVAAGARQHLREHWNLPRL